MPQLSHIDHIVLTVRDPEATIAFYRDLGLMPEEFVVADGTTRRALMGGGFKINLHPADAPYAPHAENPVPGAADLCFVSTSPIAEWVDRLGDKVIEGPVARTGARGPITSVYLRDPDGNLIEIASYG